MFSFLIQSAIWRYLKYLRFSSQAVELVYAAQRSQELWSTIPPCPHELPTIFCRIFRFWASLTILTKLGSFLFTVSFTIQLSREQELQHVSLRSQHCATRLAVSVAWICGLDHTLRGKRRAWSIFLRIGLCCMVFGIGIRCELFFATRYQYTARAPIHRCTDWIEGLGLAYLFFNWSLDFLLGSI